MDYAPVTLSGRELVLQISGPTFDERADIEFSLADGPPPGLSVGSCHHSWHILSLSVAELSTILSIYTLAEKDNGVLITPKRMVNPDDVLTREEVLSFPRPGRKCGKVSR
jgi:hypothetical protein